MTPPVIINAIDSITSTVCLFCMRILINPLVPIATVEKIDIAINAMMGAKQHPHPINTGLAMINPAPSTAFIIVLTPFVHRHLVPVS